MIFDPLPQRDKSDDQAQGLRNRQRFDPAHGVAAAQLRTLPWPRLVLISELPSSDVGARFAFHLSCALSTNLPAHGQEALLIDLAPAASRLPQVLADHVPAPAYLPLWQTISSGQPLAACPLNQRVQLSIAAEPATAPCSVDQLPRHYEQLMRMLSRQEDRYRWIVMLGLDTVVPLDKACWQAADDVILIGASELSGCRRQAAVLRSRIDDAQPERTLWTLPKRPLHWLRPWQPRWLTLRQHANLQTQWLEAGVASQCLPAVSWPEQYQASSLRLGCRTDAMLAGCAGRVAQRLRLAAACHDKTDGVVNSAGTQKKIQLCLGSRPIDELSEEFRA